MSDDAVTIRTYHPDHLEGCRSLWEELVEHHRDLYDAPTIGGDEPGLEFDDHLALVGPERVWVAVIGGAVVGLTGLIVRDAEGELEPMIVARAHRRAGVASALAARVLETARALDLVSLSVRPVARNREAIAFFHGVGFDLIGHVELFRWLGSGRTWHDGERLADRGFGV